MSSRTASIEAALAKLQGGAVPSAAQENTQTSSRTASIEAALAQLQSQKQQIEQPVQPNPTAVIPSAEAQAAAINEAARNNAQRKAAHQQAMAALKTETPTFLERVGKTVSGGIKQSVGSAMDTIGLPIEAANAQGQREVQKYVGEEAAQIAAALPGLEAALAAETDPTKKAQMQADVDRLRAQLEKDNARLNDTSVTYGENLRNKAMEVTQSGAADIERAKEGAGKLGQFAVDVGAAGTQMLGDVATGAPMLSMMVRSFGGASQNAKAKGYDLKQQTALGLASAATEYFSEKLFGGNPVYDSDAGLINKLVGKVTSNENILKALDSLPADLLSEGLEEVVAGVLEPLAEGVIAGNWEKLDVAQLGKDAAVGIALAGLGIGGNKAVNAVTGRGQVNTQPATTQTDTAALNAQNEQQSANTDNIGQNVLDLVNEAVNGKEKNASEETAENTRLSESDLAEYMKTGDRQHVRNAKERQITNGGSPILTTISAVRDFISQSISGKLQNTIKGYGKVGNRLAEAAKTADTQINKDKLTGEPLDIAGYYLELESNHLAHLSDHIDADKDVRNVPLTQEEALKIPEYIDSFDDVIDVIRRKDGSVRLKIGTKINGYSVVVEWVSKGRNSLHPVTAWKMSTEDYLRKYKGGKTQKQATSINTSHAHEVAQMDINRSTPVTANVAQTEPVVKRETVEDGLGDEYEYAYTNSYDAEDQIDSGKSVGAAEAAFTVGSNAYQNWVNSVKDPIRDTHNVSSEQAINLAIQQGREATAIPKVNPFGRLTSKHVQTLINSGATPERFANSLKQDLANGAFSYMAYTDKEAIANAEAILKDESWQTAYGRYKEAVSRGISSKDVTTLGIVLYNNAVTYGDSYAAMDVVSLMVQNSRNVAQAQQANRILNKLSPDSRLYMAVKSVENLEGEIKAKYKDKAPELKIDDTLLKDYREALVAQDDAAVNEAWGNITQNIADQIPSTWPDKINAWRYLMMLGNPRTHARNIAGNAGFMPVWLSKYALGSGIERGIIGEAGENSGRSKALFNPFSAEGKALLQTAWADYAEVEDAIQSGGKYSDNTMDIEDKRTIFKTDPIEAVRVRNEKLLNKEDRWFSQPAYAVALAGYLKANGITAAEYSNMISDVKAAPASITDIKVGDAVYASDMGNYGKVLADNGDGTYKVHFKFPQGTEATVNLSSALLTVKGRKTEAKLTATTKEEAVAMAREYAIKEAQKATYRDVNQFSEFASKLGKNYAGDNVFAKATNKAIEAVLPFKKTPANILVRAVEYSPIELGKTLTVDIRKVQKGEMSAAEMIDHLSSGLVGTALVGFGALMRRLGIVSGGDDEEKAQAFKELIGEQNYALLTASKNFTLDWLAPEALPFFVGVELYDSITDRDPNGNALSNTLDALANISEPMLDMSMLSGVEDMLSTIKYSEGNLIAKLAKGIVVSYLSQFIPTLGGQIERTFFENQRETTFIDRNSNISADTQYAIGRVMNKLPFEYHQIPYIDAWGRTESAGNILERGLENMIAPWYTNKNLGTATEAELQRLYEAGYTNVYPQRVSQSDKIDNEYLTAEEYVSYATSVGQKSLEFVRSLQESEAYKLLGDADKAEAVSDMYSWAKKLAKEEIRQQRGAETKLNENEQAMKELSPSDYVDALTSITALNNMGDGHISEKDLRLYDKTTEVIKGAGAGVLDVLETKDAYKAAIVDGQLMSSDEYKSFKNVETATSESLNSYFADSLLDDVINATQRDSILDSILDFAQGKAESEVLNMRGEKEYLSDTESVKRNLSEDELISFLVYNKAFTDAFDKNATSEEIDIFDTLMGDYANLSKDTKNALSDVVDSFDKVYAATSTGLSMAQYHKVTDSGSAQYQMCGTIAGFTGFSDNEKVQFMKVFVSDSAAKKIQTAFDSGYSPIKISAYLKCKYFESNKTNMEENYSVYGLTYNEWDGLYKIFK